MSVLAGIVAANRAGESSGGARGIPSWCTAHGPTLEAVLAAYRDDDAPILIEATCNQVNQLGGYTGMTPADFRAFVHALAAEAKIAPGRIVLGGDHLGPNPFRRVPAGEAMDKAKAMVAAYVAAGFDKIHLDASMACADDEGLDEPEMAARAADLAVVAEQAAKGRPLAYVIGTEVPVPGGETEMPDRLAVTDPAAARRTVALHREAFAARGLDAAFGRVLAVVVQPGVDFGNERVVRFDPAAAAALGRSAEKLPGVAFEAHSTDYQDETALRGLVAAHFAVLKVGPELTFAYRQAVLALSRVEAALEPAQPSGIEEAILAEMRDAPEDWRPYVAEGPRETAMMLYGLSDRVRYYWTRPRISEALARLHANIAAGRPEPGIVAQATGGLVTEDDPATLGRRIVADMVGAVVAKYRRAAER